MKNGERCVVCKKQKKGSCGSDTAHRDCLNRQAGALGPPPPAAAPAPPAAAVLPRGVPPSSTPGARAATARDPDRPNPDTATPGTGGDGRGSAEGSPYSAQGEACEAGDSWTAEQDAALQVGAERRPVHVLC